MSLLPRVLSSTAFFVVLAAGCASQSEPSPSDDSIGQTSEAQCADGTKPGCGPCYADPSSSLGGTETCARCNGTTYDKACVPPPPCGNEGDPCCDPTYMFPTCGPWLKCIGGTCKLCGYYGGPCCDTFNNAAECGGTYSCHHDECVQCPCFG